MPLLLILRLTRWVVGVDCTDTWICLQTDLDTLRIGKQVVVGIGWTACIVEDMGNNIVVVGACTVEQFRVGVLNSMNRWVVA